MESTWWSVPFSRNTVISFDLVDHIWINLCSFLLAMCSVCFEDLNLDDRFSYSMKSVSDTTLIEPLRRPRDKVMSFLEQQCGKGGIAVGDRLPASRMVARHLGVSLTTVQNVFRQLAAEGVVRTEPGSGSFLEAPFPINRRRTLRIGLSFGVPTAGEPSGPWSMAISGSIMRSASASMRAVSIHPVTVPNEPVRDILAALRKQQGKVDAMILHPVLDGAEIAAQEADLSYPVVYLNPGFTTALTNFVSADFYGVSRRLGSAWVKAGRRRVLFVHNSGERMNSSAALRCAGLVAGLGNAIGNDLDLRVVTGDDLSAEAGHALAEQLLADVPKSALPDAIYLVGDALAVGFCQYLQKRGVDIPGGTSVVAGSGFSNLPAPFGDLTRTRQPVERIGAGLLEMACLLADSEVSEAPGRFIPCSFNGGTTTTPLENQCLGID